MEWTRNVDMIMSSFEHLCLCYVDTRYLIKYPWPEREREYLKTFFGPVGNRTQAARL
jgi:hypothetical protein